MLDSRDEPRDRPSTVDAVGATGEHLAAAITPWCSQSTSPRSGTWPGAGCVTLRSTRCRSRWAGRKPARDGSPVFVQWRSIERTLDEAWPDGERLRWRHGSRRAASRRRVPALPQEALPAARLMLAVQGSPATGPRWSRQSCALVCAVACTAARRCSAGPGAALLDVLSRFGFPPWLIAAAGTNGPAVWGLPPDTPGTGLAALGFTTRHLVGVGRPVERRQRRLPAALASCVRAHGGRIVTGARVKCGVTISGGRVRGVRLADGQQVAAGTVISACDPRTARRLARRRARGREAARPLGGQATARRVRVEAGRGRQLASCAAPGRGVARGPAAASGSATSRRPRSARARASRSPPPPGCAMAW